VDTVKDRVGFNAGGRARKETRPCKTHRVSAAGIEPKM
jgi:hypothetical protein